MFTKKNVDLQMTRGNANQYSNTFHNCSLGKSFFSNNARKTTKVAEI